MLMAAARSGSLDAVKALLLKGAQPTPPSGADRPR